MKKNNEYEDDGRTIADMSMIDHPSFLKAFKKKDENQISQDNKEKLSAKNTLFYCLGALKAALIIGCIYGVVYFLVIWLMTMYFKR